MIKKLLFLVLTLSCASTTYSQAWSGIIDAKRAIDWTGAGIPGGIPNRTTICSSLTSSASATTINSAIQSCPTGQVVFLAAGNYTLSAGITFNGKSNVTLRGAGPQATKLTFSGGTSCGGQGGDVCIIDSNPVYVGSAAVQPGGGQAGTWTAGYTQGGTSITVSSNTGLSVGQWIMLDQANDLTDTGGVITCDVDGTCHLNSDSGSSNGRTISGVDYNQIQQVKITSISGTTIGITPPLYMPTWRTGQTPKYWWTGTVTGDGVENLQIIDNNSGTTSLFYFYDANASWAMNVETQNGNRNHYWLYQSNHNVIRDGYAFGTQNAGTESYGVETDIGSDNLVENMIFEQVASPIMSGGGTGNVFGYNFSINNLYTLSASWMQNSFSSHDAGNSMELFEGDMFNAIDCDDVHGTSGLMTYYRVQATGSQSGKSLNTHAMKMDSFCRGFNVINSVLGTSGFTTTYQVEESSGSGTGCDVAVYNIGWATSSCSGFTGTPNDSQVLTSMFRYGNYDTVHASVQCNSSEVPTAWSPYPNAVPSTCPSSAAYPNSFYLSGKPAFWGTRPWPGIGSDLTGGNVANVGGHVYTNPAGDCYNNTSSTGGIKNFDSANCYYLSPTTTNSTVIGKGVTFNAGAKFR